MAASRFIDDYRGMSASGGPAVSAEAHLRQSIRTILTTPVGSRLMRRDFGSRLAELVDQPMTPSLRADLVAATADALRRFEPRISVKRVRVVAAEAGRWTLDLVVEARAGFRDVAGVRPFTLEGVI